MRKLLILLLFLPCYSIAAIDGDAVQCSSAIWSDVNGTIGPTTSWSRPTAGNLLIIGGVVRSPFDANFDYSPDALPSGFTQIGITSDNLDNGGIGLWWAWKEADGDATEDSITVYLTSDPNNWQFFGCEFDSTDIDISAGVDDSDIDDTNETTDVTSQTSGTATNTIIEDALVIAFIGTEQLNLWDASNSWTNSFVEQVERVSTQSGSTGLLIATKVVSSTGAKTTTLSTTDTGSHVGGAIAIFPGFGSASMSDLSPTPGTTVSYICGSSFGGNITTLTTPESDTISAESGADTCNADFIIPNLAEYVSTGSMNNTEWDVDGTWTVGDGTTTENVTMQIDPPTAANFGLALCTAGTNCPGNSVFTSPTTTVDDVYFNFTSGTGTCNFYGACVTDTQTADIDVYVYDDGAGAWLALRDVDINSNILAPVLYQYYKTVRR